ncbi:hypothetical protein E2C01_058935 [Portunus trituberculatus]|uniref:Uncharacterized protein n=1 Tax=Portunus trituberculatus TaxID=210409 RepID=A0A5B7H7P9_PORTR|nr:hypothetical protein [Portunus trituberculatus]
MTSAWWPLVMSLTGTLSALPPCLIRPQDLLTPLTKAPLCFHHGLLSVHYSAEGARNEGQPAERERGGLAGETFNL